MIGLQKGTVKLSENNYGEWQDAFNSEKSLIENTLGTDAREIHHIGSTSVPGLMAKPIIDIIVVIESLDDYKKYIKPLQELGYHFMPDGVFEIRDRVFFPKGPEHNRTHHLSLTTKESSQYTETLRFRDILRSNDDIRDEYQALKLDLSKKYASDRKSYTDAKADFITKVLTSH